MGVWLLFLGSMLVSSKVAYAQITGWTVPSIATGSGTGTLSVAESSASGATVATVAATPTGGDAIASYTITPASTVFSLTSPAGVLTLATTVDYETATQHVINIVAVDDNGTPNTVTATVTITVTDVDDTAPSFSPATQRSCIADNAAVGTTAMTLSTSDPDTTPHNPTYAIHAIDGVTSNANHAFQITTGSNKITVNTGASINATANPAYTVLVDANDGTQTGTGTIIINIGDCCSGASAAVMGMIFVLLVSVLASLI